MNAFFAFLHTLTHDKKVWKTVLFLPCFLFLFFLSSCSKEVDYFSYVSELRSNVFLAQEGELSLRIFSVKKESPYEADGIVKEIFERTEFYLSAPSGDREYTLSFCVNDEEQRAVMSFDNMKGEYYYFCSLDISQLESIECTLVCEKQTETLLARSVKTPTMLSPSEILETVRANESELFSSMTDKYGFAGEIYLRLIYEDAPFYYVGVIDRNGNVTAFLLNGETGKILAKRSS